MLRKQARRQRRWGAVTVEFAVVFMIFATFMFSVFEYARFILIRHVVDNATREAARLAAANPSFKYVGSSSSYTSYTQTTSDIQNTVINYLGGLQLQNSSGSPLAASDVQVYRAVASTGLADSSGIAWNNSGFGDAVVVQVQVQVKAMLPGFHFLQPTTTLTFASMMRSEGNN